MTTTMLRPQETTAGGADQAHVVRDAGGRVVLVCWGRDSAAEAAAWFDRGYRVDAVDRLPLTS